MMRANQEKDKHRKAIDFDVRRTMKFRGPASIAKVTGGEIGAAYFFRRKILSVSSRLNCHAYQYVYTLFNLSCSQLLYIV